MEYPTERIAIRSLMQQLMDRWAAGDAEGYAQLFTKDAPYVAFDGTVQNGQAGIMAAHRPLFEKWLKNSRLIGDISEIRFLTPDVALVLTQGNTIPAGQETPSSSRESIQTLVAVKQKGEWRFASFHNTRVRPISTSLRNFIAWRLADLFWTLLGTKKGG
jgi:uncharacterized protein (TIGR02246 family)